MTLTFQDLKKNFNKSREHPYARGSENHKESDTVFRMARRALNPPAKVGEQATVSHFTARSNLCESSYSQRLKQTHIFP
jgi:hypothetical protein